MRPLDEDTRTLRWITHSVTVATVIVRMHRAEVIPGPADVPCAATPHCCVQSVGGSSSASVAVSVTAAAEAAAQTPGLNPLRARSA
jgi:hypothetical protein